MYLLGYRVCCTMAGPLWFSSGLVVVLLMVPTLLPAPAHGVRPSFSFVTCGSSFKLAHTRSGARLHSHEVKYGSNGGSSGQNSVTGMQSQSDANSHWKLVGAQGAACPSGKPISCGSEFSLVHVKTGCKLHSHSGFKSPLSKNQEVSAVGCPSAPTFAGGDGDPGDTWTVECSNFPDYWMRDDYVRLQHKQTGMWLHHTMEHTYRRPIAGQKEICAVSYKDDNGLWVAQEGLFVKVDHHDGDDVAAGATDRDEL